MENNTKAGPLERLQPPETTQQTLTGANL